MFGVWRARAAMRPECVRVEGTAGVRPPMPLLGRTGLKHAAIRSAHVWHERGCRTRPRARSRTAVCHQSSRRSQCVEACLGRCHASGRLQSFAAPASSRGKDVELRLPLPETLRPSPPLRRQEVFWFIVVPSRAGVRPMRWWPNRLSGPAIARILTRTSGLSGARATQSVSGSAPPASLATPSRVRVKPWTVTG